MTVSKTNEIIISNEINHKNTIVFQRGQVKYRNKQVPLKLTK